MHLGWASGVSYLRASSPHPEGLASLPVMLGGPSSGSYESADFPGCSSPTSDGQLPTSWKGRQLSLGAKPGKLCQELTGSCSGFAQARRSWTSGQAVSWLPGLSFCLLILIQKVPARSVHSNPRNPTHGLRAYTDNSRARCRRTQRRRLGRPSAPGPERIGTPSRAEVSAPFPSASPSIIGIQPRPPRELSPLEPPPPEAQNWAPVGANSG